MSIFDTFGASVDSAASVVKKSASEVGGSINSATQKALGIGAGDKENHYKVVIVAKIHGVGDIHIIADCPDSFSFDTALSYGAPFQEAISKKADEAMSGPIGSLVGAGIKASGTRLFTKNLTAKVWEGAADMTLTIPLIFQAETSGDTDVMLPVMQLMALSMPAEKELGGFLSSPGPVFDWGAAADSVSSGATTAANKVSNKPVQELFGGLSDVGGSLYDSGKALIKGDLKGAIGTVSSGVNKKVAELSNKIDKYIKNKISIQIGEAFYLDNIVIKSVGQVQKMQPIGTAYGKSDGVNSRIEVSLTIEPFTTLTQRDIVNMLMPLNTKGGEKAKTEFDKIVGGGKNAK
jgi:hypothetical protein